MSFSPPSSLASSVHSSPSSVPTPPSSSFPPRNLLLDGPSQASTEIIRDPRAAKALFTAELVRVMAETIFENLLAVVPADSKAREIDPSKGSVVVPELKGVFGRSKGGALGAGAFKKALKDAVAEDPSLCAGLNELAPLLASYAANPDGICAHCRRPHARMRCSLCRSVSYCHREHQVVHWKYHNAICKKLKARGETVWRPGMSLDPGKLEVDFQKSHESDLRKVLAVVKLQDYAPILAKNGFTVTSLSQLKGRAEWAPVVERTGLKPGHRARLARYLERLSEKKS